jgi:GMP synthase-like glutamine amidotransferase
MKIHYLQHVPFEDLGSMAPHLQSRGHELSCSHLYKSELTHAPDDLDWLIIMGGPMGVHDERVHPWLKDEKAFIRAVIGLGKPVLGICLGAQLAAEALGAKVYPNTFSEIGWFPVKREAAPSASPLAAVFPDKTNAFHWHGDTFDIPQGAIRLASSAACRNQGFIWKDQVLGLQFHLEMTQASAEALIAHCMLETEHSTWVQQPSAMMKNPSRFNTINLLMNKVLDTMETLASNRSD